jgi:hypothetical protein
LRDTDQAVAAGRFASRQEAFVDFARRAVRALSPDVSEDISPEELGQELLAYAEGAEDVGP